MINALNVKIVIFSFIIISVLINVHLNLCLLWIVVVVDVWNDVQARCTLINRNYVKSRFRIAKCSIKRDGVKSVRKTITKWKGIMETSIDQMAVKKTNVLKSTISYRMGN